MHPFVAGQRAQLGDVALAVVPDGEALQQVGIDRLGLEVVAAQLLQVHEHGVGGQAVGHGPRADQVRAEHDVHALRGEGVAHDLGADAEPGESVAEGGEEIRQPGSMGIVVRLDEHELHLPPMLRNIRAGPRCDLGARLAGDGRRGARDRGGGSQLGGGAMGASAFLMAAERAEDIAEIGVGAGGAMAHRDRRLHGLEGELLAARARAARRQGRQRPGRSRARSGWPAR